MDEQARLAELEQWIEQKKRAVGVNKFNRNSSHYPEFNEYITLKTKLNSQANRAARAAAVQAEAWRNDPATGSQLVYLAKLRVKAEPRMTKGRASDLIEAAQRGELGSVGGWYVDGSN